MLTLVL